MANSTEGPELRIDLTLSTLFARDAQDEPAPTARRRPPPPAHGRQEGRHDGNSRQRTC